MSGPETWARDEFMAEGADWDSDECWACGGTGEQEHDCGEDCCCCLEPLPDSCEVCHGRGSIQCTADTTRDHET